MEISQLWTDDQNPPPKVIDVLSQIAHFLDQLGYTKTFASLYKESKKNGLILDIAEWERGIQAKTAIPLLDLYEEWYDANDKHPTLPESEDEAGGAAEDSGDSDDESEDEDEPEQVETEGALLDIEAEETSDDDSDEESDSSSDESVASPSKAGTKRKRVSSPSSSEEDSDSDSDSDESSSSDDSDAPPAKKAKVATQVKSDASSKSAFGSDSDSDGSSGSSSSSSSSDSDSDSDSSASSESEASDDEKEKKAPKKQAPVVEKKVAKKAKKSEAGEAVKTTVSTDQPKDAGSLSSATLEGESGGEKENDSSEPSHIHPDRLKQMPATKKEPTTKKELAADAKKKQVPFSRIPTDQRVDPKFASNEYVSYDYADRAFRDLSVTKGKGFTKEKNKKKRGAYRGGAIDLTPKGIKFED